MSKLGLRLHADEEHWIPLSDLMTGLMFLFLLISLVYMVAAEIKGARPINALKGYVAGRAQIASDLRSALGPDLQRWHATLDPTTLSITFSGNTGLFARGSAEIEPQFQAALNEFFPRYVAVLARHQADVREIRIEGFTSTAWPSSGDSTTKYLQNMALSQGRARAVLAYVLNFGSIRARVPWLKQVASADGFSYAHIVRTTAGAEDAVASDRVEFHVLTGSADKIVAALKVAPSARPEAKATPTPPPPPSIAAALPPYPAWSAPLIGTPLRSAFPHSAVRCFGYLDVVLGEYQGRPSGAEVSGWAFDLANWRPVKRVLLVNALGVIVGAADGGYDRADVQQNIRWISSANTGWRGSVSATKGPIVPWAIMASPKTVCPLKVAPAVSHERF